MAVNWTTDDSIGATVDLMRRGKLSAIEIAREALQRIGRLNPLFNALLCTSQTALQEAAEIQQRLEHGQSVGPLAGIPLTIKDLIVTRDMPTTAGSRLFGDGLTGQRDALLVSRLRRAGAIVVGKAHLHEFAYGVTNENAHYGPARNPYNRDLVSGGSSGGSAVSVAAGMCLGSVGTDTRGSIRIPSAFCGLVGLKPTRGHIPLKGVLPLSWTLDHAGPIARTVRDVALLYQVLSCRRVVELPVLSDPRKLKIGICEYYWSGLDREIDRPLQDVLKLIKGAHCETQKVSIPGIDEALEASRILAASDALAYHREHIRRRPEGYDPAVLSRMIQGEQITGVEVAEAFHLRRTLRESFRKVFRQVDVLLGATVPCLPPRIGAGVVAINGKQAPTVDQLVRFNSPQNIAGTPALVLPCGSTRTGLPVAVQLIARHGNEQTLLSVGDWLQRHVITPGAPWHEHPARDLE